MIGSSNSISGTNGIIKFIYRTNEQNCKIVTLMCSSNETTTTAYIGVILTRIGEKSTIELSRGSSKNSTAYYDLICNNDGKYVSAMLVDPILYCVQTKLVQSG